MRVRMTRDLDVAFDGNTVQKLRQGETYDIPESFAKRYLDKRIAVEDKAIDKSPETKTIATKKTTRKRAKS